MGKNSDMTHKRHKKKDKAKRTYDLYGPYTHKNVRRLIKKHNLNDKPESNKSESNNKCFSQKES